MSDFAQDLHVYSRSTHLQWLYRSLDENDIDNSEQSKYAYCLGFDCMPAMCGRDEK